jgi:hypothetical protein
MKLLAKAANHNGSLSPDLQALFDQFFSEPTVENWDRLASLIINPGSMRRGTVWQAVVAVDPTFQRSKGKEGWLRAPDALTVARAVKEATATSA